MTEEEFLGYEEESFYGEEEKKKSFFAALAQNPKVPIFAFAGLVVLVALSFGIYSISSSWEDLPKKEVVAPIQDKDLKEEHASTENLAPTTNLPKGSISLNPEEETIETADPSEVPSSNEHATEAPQDENTEKLVAQEPLKNILMPDYKAVQVDHKEEEIIANVAEIKAENNAPAPPAEPVIEELAPVKEVEEVAPEQEAPEVPEGFVIESHKENSKKSEAEEVSSDSGLQAFNNVYRTGNYRKLTPDLMSELIKSVDYRFKKIGKKNNACIEMNAISGNDRAFSYAKEVQSFLRGQGYEVSAGINQVFLTKPVQDVWVWFRDDCVSITVGTPKH